MKILIVEDEVLISNLIKINLEDAGYQCVCAFDGQEAADLIESQAFDLVLLDIMLPKINGFELMDYIRSFETPVIFCKPPKFMAKFFIIIGKKIKVFRNTFIFTYPHSKTHFAVGISYYWELYLSTNTCSSLRIS